MLRWLCLLMGWCCLTASEHVNEAHNETGVVFEENILPKNFGNETNPSPQSSPNESNSTVVDPFLLLPDKKKNETIKQFLSSNANKLIQKVQEKANARTDKLLLRMIELPHEFHHSEVKFVSVVGKGGLGLVFKALIHGTVFAVKGQIDDSHRSRLFEKEIEISRRFRHPNFATFVGTFLGSGGELYMVSEFMAGGTLASFVARRHLTWASGLHIALQIARALQYLHLAKPSLMYRDLKMQNIMLTDEYATEVKLVDLGMVVASGKPVRTSTGTPDFMAPEVVEGTYLHRIAKNYTIHRYTTAVDIWAFAGILFCMFSGHSHTPFPQYYDSANTMLAIKNGLRYNWSAILPEFSHPLLLEMLRNCTKENPAERIGINQIIDVLHRLRVEKVQFQRRNCTSVRERFAPVYGSQFTSSNHSLANHSNSTTENSTSTSNVTEPATLSSSSPLNASCSHLYLFNEEINDFVWLLKGDSHFREREDQSGIRKKKPATVERKEKRNARKKKEQQEKEEKEEAEQKRQDALLTPRQRKRKEEKKQKQAIIREQEEQREKELKEEQEEKRDEEEQKELAKRKEREENRKEKEKKAEKFKKLKLDEDWKVQQRLVELMEEDLWRNKDVV